MRDAVYKANTGTAITFTAEARDGAVAMTTGMSNLETNKGG